MARVLLCVRGGAEGPGEPAAVAAALRERGAEPVALDPTAFPTGMPLTLAYDRAGFRVQGDERRELAAPRGGNDRRDAREVFDDLGGIAAVWQRVVVGTELPTMEPGVRETCVAASERALVGLLDSLQVFQLDPYANQSRADGKPHQLRIAQRLGLEIPETIISNDAARVRAFARRHGTVVTKMLVQPASTGPVAGGEASVVFTTEMAPEDLQHLDGLDLCPMIFQERVESQRDVRVTVVGKRVFGAALDRSAGAGVDWRRESYALDRAPSWVPYELPAPVAERLLRLLGHFGLNYGAADFLVRPDGRHVFLELNASGSFAFLGAREIGPIAAAIAEILLDPGARRVPSDV